MKTNNLKFLLALGGAKMVMLDAPGRAPVFYAHAEQTHRAKRTDVKRIAALLNSQPK